MLSEEFLKPYREAGDCFPNLLARATYLSKFCRNGESWTDTVKRVVEDNVSKDPNVSEDEAKELFDAIWNMRVMPPGRGLWTGGVAGMHPAAKFNCWGTVLDSPEEWCWTADMLMLGGGVGVSLLEIDKLPVVKGFSRLYIGCSSEHPNVGEVQPDFVGDRVYSIPDSREGWVDALRTVLAAGFSGRDARVDVTGVRERGAPIRTFGGVACGPGPLVHLLRKVNEILNGAIGRKLTSVECLDITNYVGLCIRSGNVRRSALITLGHVEDQAFRDAKKDFAAVLSHRSTSNNSIVLQGGEVVDWDALVRDMSEFGEPGIVNMARIRVDDDSAVTVNPCAEISLHKREACCLVEFFPSRCESLTAARKAAVLATRYCLRQRLDRLPDPESDAKQQANMRLGVAIGGVCDFDWNTRTLDRLYLDVRCAADDYSLELGVNAPIAVTCIKPSGTISLLAGASPGMHAPFAPYYIRRARFASNDPMVAHLVAAGVPMEPDQYDQTLNTLVASFPIANPGLKVYVANETVDDQITRLVDLQNHWADNAVSATVSFEKHEEGRLAQLLDAHIQDIKSVSCLPKAHGYTQAPYEEITKEQYDSLVAGIDNTAKLTYGGDVLVDECSTGACPIR